MCIDNDTHFVVCNANDLALNNDNIFFLNRYLFGTSTTEKNIINVVFNIPNTVNNVCIEKKLMFCYVIVNKIIRHCLLSYPLYKCVFH